MKSRGTPIIDALEPRRLFAAAPPTLLGLSANVNVEDGTGTFVAGDYKISADLNSHTYHLTGPGGAIVTQGTFSYGLISTDTGQLTINDQLLGTFSVTLKFTTATSGSATIKYPSLTPITADFDLSGVNFASVSSGVLTVSGTIDGDKTVVTVSGGQIKITRNNITQQFPLSSVNHTNVTMGDGNDVFDATGITAPMYINAGGGNDRIVGTDANDTLTGGAGKNTLLGNGGDDRLNGSGSRDLLFGGPGSDRLYGGAGDDTLEGGGGVDRIWGGDGNDLLIGGGSNDKLFGEAGDDELHGNAGADILEGGTGTNALFQ